MRLKHGWQRVSGLVQVAAGVMHNEATQVAAGVMHNVLLGDDIFLHPEGSVSLLELLSLLCMCLCVEGHHGADPPASVREHCHYHP
jgi:hypothetical protein